MRERDIYIYTYYTVYVFIYIYIYDCVFINQPLLPEQTSMHFLEATGNWLTSRDAWQATCTTCMYIYIYLFIYIYIINTCITYIHTFIHTWISRRLCGTAGFEKPLSIFESSLKTKAFKRYNQGTRFFENAVGFARTNHPHCVSYCIIYTPLYTILYPYYTPFLFHKSLTVWHCGSHIALGQVLSAAQAKCHECPGFSFIAM